MPSCCALQRKSVPTGRVKTVFSNGETCIAHYKKGVRHGKVTFFRTDGVKYLIQYYENGILLRETWHSPKW